jgi:hypothetical protein
VRDRRRERNGSDAVHLLASLLLLQRHGSLSDRTTQWHRFRVFQNYGYDVECQGSHPYLPTPLNLYPMFITFVNSCEPTARVAANLRFLGLRQHIGGFGGPMRWKSGGMTNTQGDHILGRRNSVMWFICTYCPRFTLTFRANSFQSASCTFAYSRISRTPLVSWFYTTFEHNSSVPCSTLTSS